MPYEFEMGDFFTYMMYYATLMFNALIPIGAIAVGLTFGVGMVLLIIKLVKGSITGLG